MILMNQAMMGGAGYQAVSSEQQIRYLRVRITSLWDESELYGTLSEVEFYNRPDDSRVLVNSIASANPVFSSSYQVASLIDGEVADTSRWLPAVSSLPHIFQVDFGSIVSVNSVIFRNASYKPLRVMKDFTIDASEDGVIWGQVLSAQTDYDLVATPYGAQEFTFA
jgi:hypothetical protein